MNCKICGAGLDPKEPMCARCKWLDGLGWTDAELGKHSTYTGPPMKVNLISVPDKFEPLTFRPYPGMQNNLEELMKLESLGVGTLVRLNHFYYFRISSDRWFRVVSDARGEPIFDSMSGLIALRDLESAYQESLTEEEL